MTAFNGSSAIAAAVVMEGAGMAGVRADKDSDSVDGVCARAPALTSAAAAA